MTTTRRIHSTLAFFVESAQPKHGLDKLHRVDGAAGDILVVLDPLQHAGAAEAPEYLCGIVLVTTLREMRGMRTEAARRARPPGWHKPWREPRCS